MKVHERYIGRVYESKLSLELFIIKLTKQITITRQCIVWNSIKTRINDVTEVVRLSVNLLWHVVGVTEIKIGHEMLTESYIWCKLDKNVFRFHIALNLIYMKSFYVVYKMNANTTFISYVEVNSQWLFIIYLCKQIRCCT